MKKEELNSEEENANDIYRIAAKVKNLARENDCSLTPIGESLCNLYILVLKDFYDFAKTIGKPTRGQLEELIKLHENFPAKVIELGRKKKN